MKPVENMPSVAELRVAIPTHCFERSLLKSLFFVLRDGALVATIGGLACALIPMDMFGVWVVYAALQGTVAAGLWVIGHECGHGAFCASPMVNDVVGFVLHTAMLVPYFSWQRTHAVHHARCNHLLDGESHNPGLKRKLFSALSATVDAIGEDAFVVVQIVSHLLFGWAMYLLKHTTGSKRNPVTKQRYTRRPNHFNPHSELFPVKLRFKVALSTAGIVAMVALLCAAAARFGARPVAMLYVGPYLVVNGWLVLYTWLQHTSKEVPQYGEDEWTWIKGALSAVDRPYPWIIDELHHHIGSTHVCHHVFHELPHYHAVEATRALKRVLGKHYRYDATPILQALWNTARDCHYVDDVSGVQYYRSVFDDRQKKN
jgi:fatty acid desaturase